MKYALMVRNDDLSKKTALKIKESLQNFFIYDEKNPDLVISIGGDGTILEAVHQYLNVDCCPYARKPRKAKFIKVLKEYKLDLSEVAIIGDQLVTDIYGGNRVGITTVLVNPMSDIDMPFTKIHRYIERKEINKMNKKGIFKVGEYYD